MVFLTPENADCAGFRDVVEALERNRVSVRIIVDEAHCISDWGHSFRTSYQALTELCARLVTTSRVAMTATATSMVRVQ